METCWNGEIEEWENCKNCPEDVWECTAHCGNGKVEAAEDCRNCEKDVWKCSATCGNGKIEAAEDCKNCPEDVKLCKSETCGNGVVDEWAWEECDGWKDKAWNEVRCTKMCTIYDENNPNKGNGEIDEWEDCKNSPEDLWEKCIDKWDEKICGDGKVDIWEECDPKDSGRIWWWDEWCSNSCHKIDRDSWVCNPEYDWKAVWNLLNQSWLCLRWKMQSFSLIINKWSWLCVDETTQKSVKCVAYRSICWDWIVWDNEKCDNCQKDLKDICIDDWKDWDDEDDRDEKCDCSSCPEKRKDICVDDWDDEDDWDEKCDCSSCPEKRKDICIDRWDYDNDDGDDDNEDCKCDECPEKLKESCIGDPTPIIEDDNPDDWGDDEENNWWSVTNDSCNSCPCEYADFATDLVKWDSIRAKLWDKSLSAFYRYSNSVAIDSLLDSNGGWGDSWGWWSWNPTNDDKKTETRKAKLIVRRDEERLVREFEILSDRIDTPVEENLGIWARFKKMIWL